MAIISAAVAVESLGVTMRSRLGYRFNLWNPGYDNIRCIKEVRIVHSINNIIKHNQSEIHRSKSNSAKYLVENCGFADGVFLRCSEIDVEHSLFCTYVFLLEMVQETTQIKIPLLSATESDIQYQFEALVPSILKVGARHGLLRNKFMA
jgi:hypothetical protein